MDEKLKLEMKDSPYPFEEFYQNMDSSEMLDNTNLSSAMSESTEPSVIKSNKRKAEDDGPVLYKKAGCVLKGMKSAELHAILYNDPIAFCQEVGILPESVKCFCCNENMRLETQHGALKRQMMWICRKKGNKKSRSIRMGTWFETSKAPVADVLWMMYMWLYKFPTNLMIHETDHSPKVIIGWNKKCVEVCRLILEMKNEPLGGEGKIVEIFDYKFKGKNLRNWGFCALELKSTKTLYVMVEDAKSGSLKKLLSKYILPGTTIFGLFWSRYKNLSKKDFNYLTQEKKITFYQPTLKTQMDTYEDFVAGVNRYQPLSHFVKNVNDSQFFEKMYRKSLANAPDAYIAFLEDIAMVYKPSEVYRAEERVKKEKDVIVKSEKEIKKEKIID
ncbi:hypothetical protein JTE90_023955 [Oedothorax gibbosus]|uniref:Transposase n=1 Tax=Oedothorax gibbosus TaxID=931172 RepID=A0AAV6URQ8_9ARAC|nr:hypothetical protein JTE90_023955 [Oedothorax gibbosus]